MSKNRLRNSTESNRVKNRLSAPSAQPTTQQHAQVCTGRLSAPRAPRLRAQRVRLHAHRFRLRSPHVRHCAIPCAPTPACAPSASASACAAHLRPCRAPAPMPRTCAQRRVASFLRIVLQYNAQPPATFRSQYTRLYCDTVLNPPTCLSHNTISCLAMQFFFPTNYTPLQYNLLYCNTTSNQAYLLLQYNFSLAIQFFFSQYNWATNSASIFFFIIFIFFSFVTAIGK